MQKRQMLLDGIDHLLKVIKKNYNPITTAVKTREIRLSEKKNNMWYTLSGTTNAPTDILKSLETLCNMLGMIGVTDEDMIYWTDFMEESGFELAWTDESVCEKHILDEKIKKDNQIEWYFIERNTGSSHIDEKTVSEDLEKQVIEKLTIKIIEILLRDKDLGQPEFEYDMDVLDMAISEYEPVYNAKWENIDIKQLLKRVKDVFDEELGGS